MNIYNCVMVCHSSVQQYNSCFASTDFTTDLSQEITVTQNRNKVMARMSDRKPKGLFKIKDLLLSRMFNIVYIYIWLDFPKGAR